MAIIKTRVLWYPLGLSTYIDITDAVDFNPRFGIDANSNTAAIKLKNSFAYYVSSISGEIYFQEDDIIKIFVKDATDNTEINISSTDDLIMTGYVIDLKTTLSDKKTEITLNIADRTYILLNKLWSNSYSGMTAPEIIQDIVNQTTDSGNKNPAITVGTCNYPAETAVQITRPDSSSFPDISFSQVWKPVYDWITQLSQIENTNSATEIASELPIAKRSYIFTIDTDNKLRWFYPRDNVNYTFTEGDTTTYYITDVSLDKKASDAVNMIIFNSGNDMNGTSIWGYFFDPNSNTKQLKMKYLAMTDITKTLIGSDYLTNTSRDAGTFPQYPASYPVTPYWDSMSSSYSSVANDSEYNDSLWEAATYMGQQRGRRYTAKKGKLAWKGSIKIRGKKLSAGELIEYTSSSIGIYKVKLRIKEVTHNVSSSGWYTTLDVEEDEPEVNS